MLATSVLALVAACSGGSKRPPAPVPSLSTTTVTTLPDLSHESLPAIAGVTTAPPVAITPGHAGMTGTVVDDTGAPVGGAIVGLERVVGGRSGQSSVVAGADGTWVARGILGGVYRVRAWRPPDLAGTTAQTVYLAGTGNQTLALTVGHVTGMAVQSSVAPNPPIIGEAADIVVEVTGSTVGSDGYVRAEGQPGIQLQLLGQGAWSIDGDGSALTSASGFAEWRATCEELGAQGLSVLVNGAQAYPIGVGSCSPVPTTTTTVAPSTTSTTDARKKGRTTTTA